MRTFAELGVVRSLAELRKFVQCGHAMKGLESLRRHVWPNNIPLRAVMLIFAGSFCVDLVVLVILLVRPEFGPKLGPLFRASILLTIIALVLVRVWAIRMHRMLRRHQVLLCTRCRYPLEGLGEEGQCPECGEPFNRELVIKTWQERYPRLKKQGASRTGGP